MIAKALKYVSAFVSLMSVAALATPPNSPNIDGRAIEYDSGDLRSTFTTPVGGLPGGTPNFGPDNVLTNLFVTWTTNSLSFALNGTIGQFDSPANKMALMIDVDPGNGTGAETTTNWLTGPGYITFNDVGWRKSDDISATPFGLDYMLASEGGIESILRILYNGIEIPDTNNTVNLFDAFNNIFPEGVTIEGGNIKKIDATHPLNALESTIPWSVIYGANTGRFGTIEAGEIVPRGAILRIFGNIHNNVSASPYSSTAVIPDQTSVLAGWANGIFTSDNYVDVVIDGDSNGIPDVAVGDVNAPFIKYVSGIQGKRQVFAWFNEDVESTSATDILNWLVGTDMPESITLVQSDAVLLNLTNDLPASGNFVRIEATGVEDLSVNSRTTFNFLNPSASGIETSITVRFLLNINSGFGAAAANPRATNFFVNGGVAPLEFGFPPVMTSPLTELSTTQHYRDVTFPPGTPTAINYKYSGPLTVGGLATGTNNYEAVRLANFDTAARILTLPTNGITSLVVTDWLGAAAAPFRNPATNSGYNALYNDIRRGDSGVRQRIPILFRLDLSQRNLQGVTRVLVQGSDPLRGFNLDSTGISDFAGNGPVGYEVGGVELFDNGLNGDTTANDGIFSRLWSATTNGQDTVIVSGTPPSLVGGDFDQPPYLGDWIDRRTPKSFKYKYYVFKGGTDEALESPASDIEYFIEGSPTNVILDKFVWANEALPLPPASNSPTMVNIVFTSNFARAIFTNQVTELQHGLQISTNLIQGWLDFGGRAVTTVVAGVWQGIATNATPSEHYRVFAGPAQPLRPVRFTPYPIPATGATVRIFYTQHSRVHRGNRSVHIAGNFTGWTGTPMTFMGDGTWFYDLVANTSVFPNTEIKFKPVDKAVPTIYDGMNGGGSDYFMFVGDLRAAFTPINPTNGEILSVTYDAAGGPLASATNVNAYYGFDEGWFSAAAHKMTNVIGETNIWEIAFPVPTNVTVSINFVFNGAAAGPVLWDSEGASPPNGRQWRIFTAQP